MMRHVLSGLVVVLATTLVAGAPKPEEKGKSDPPGAPVVARLVAKKDTYPLDLGGKTGEEFRKQLKDAAATGGYPEVAKVEMALELTNTTDKEVQIQINGTRNVVALDLKGPGAEMVEIKGRAQPKFLRVSETVTLAPGKSASVPISSLGYGLRNLTHAAYWTAAGEYTLSASYQTAMAPAPAGARDAGNGFGAVKLTTGPIAIKVEAK